MDLARKEDFQHSLPHRPEKWDKTHRVALVFVNALSIRGAWMELLPGLSCTKSSAGSLNTYHTRSLLLNESLLEIYQRASYLQQPHKGNANKVLYKIFPPGLFRKKKKNPNIKRFKMIPLSKLSSFIEAMRCSDSIFRASMEWSSPQRLTRCYQTFWGVSHKCSGA